MSGPSSATTAMYSLHTPLSQVLGNTISDDSTVFLVTDSLESDGRFVLGSLISTNSYRNNVLWLCCSAVTDQLTLSSIQKIEGSTKMMTTNSHLPESASGGKSEPVPPTPSRLTIRSIPTLLSRAISPDGITMDSLDIEACVKTLYREVKQWVRFWDDTSQNHNDDDTQNTQCWVVFDDVSMLANLVGDRLTYGFIMSLSALLSECKNQRFRLALRCSNDFDVETDGLVDSRVSSQCFGAASMATTDETDKHPWERHLVELADTIVDVVPLAGGFTREAHGRLLITAGPTLNERQVFNYCLTDNHPLVIPIAR